jgi:hypothetical protein
VTDEEFLAAFEQCTLHASEFNHRGHLRAAWTCLHQDRLDGPRRFDVALQRYAQAVGAPPGKYDAALTAAWIRAIARVLDDPPVETFVEFVAAHPELLSSAAVRAVSAP